MPWHPCTGTRDTITQDDGLVVNHVDYPDSTHKVTSYCRTSDGTWVAWINTVLGDTTDPSSPNPDNDPDKGDWPARIANAYALSVGYFPDDGSAATVYDLQVDPALTWSSITLYSTFDPCSILPVLGQKYSNAQRGELIAWTMDVLDVQVRTDGTNVWVVVLAREDVKYPYLADCGATLIDRCGNGHPPIQDEYIADPFAQDTGDGTGTRFWMHYQGFDGSGLSDDSGLNNGFRWHPARVTVFAGDLGGFTKLDTVEARFNNAGTVGLCGDIEACASPAEPGACHVLWAEGGIWDSFTAQIGQRITHSVWNTTSKLSDEDVVATTQDSGNSPSHIDHGGANYNSDDNWCWTGEYALRNDHGSPAAIVCPWPDHNGPGSVEYWDLSGGGLTRTLAADLYPTPSEAGFDSAGVISDGGLNTTGTQRVHFVSSLYTDPLLDDTDIYLVCIGLNNVGLGGRAFAQAIYRIPCDGSDTFDFMDGIRLSMYSIIPNGALIDLFRSDFVSDPGNVWVPASQEGGGQVLHLPRTCERTWELLPSFPVADSEFEISDWLIGTSPPSLVYDDAGDWLAGAGTGPVIAKADDDLTNIAALRAKICRCCVPCLERVGIHAWHRLA